MICRVCSKSNFSDVIDLKNQPWGNHFLTPNEVGKEPFYPLKVIYCNDCQTAQLDFTVKKEIMFSDHTYLSGITKSLYDHFYNTAKAVDDTFFKDKKDKNVLDIGSNDGTQLKAYKELGFNTLGVESSSRIALMANAQEIPTIHAFFNEDTAHLINKKFHVINASGVFFHLEELHSVTRGIKFLLDENGVFVVQFLYMKSIMENGAFDQIYHEHLLYYTLKTINTLLNIHDLEIFDAYLSPIHGGSIIAYATHKGSKPPSLKLQNMLLEEDLSGCNNKEAYLEFAKRIENIKETNLLFLHKCKQEGKTIYGMGAPVKGNTLLNYFGIDSNLLEFLVEKNPLRKGLYSPGMHIPIVLESELKNPPNVYYVLAWNFKNEILKNNQRLIQEGVEFYFPVDPQIPVTL
jgi:hypothetical protein